MKKILPVAMLILMYQSIDLSLLAQHTFFKPKEAFAIEISLPNTKLTRLPIYRNAVLSLIVDGDHILGGTSAREGLSPFVFVASLTQRDLLSYKDLEEVVRGQQSIPTGFCRAKDNLFYAGTLPNRPDGKTKAGGHIIQVKIDINGTVEIKDLGIPVPGEGIFSLLLDANSKELYGISHPSGIFFKFNIATGAVRTCDDLKPSKNDLQALYDFNQDPDTYLGKKLIKDDKGNIYGSMPINKIFCFDPVKDTFQIMNEAIPAVWGRRTLGQVESWAKAPDGKIYGGNAGDGQLFQLDPSTGKIKNLGKPIMANGLKGLVFAADGRLYGVAGAKPAETHIFTYNETEGFNDLGNPRFEMLVAGIENSFDWRAFQIGALTISEDGKYIIMGEDEDLSQLLIFKIETK